MAENSIYITFRIDQSAPDFPELVQKYRALRLDALTNAKAAFGSTYEEESAWPIEYWEQRLTRQGVEHFVIAAHRPSGEQEWLGQLVLLGPLSLEDFTLGPESGQPEDQFENAAKETRWQLTALYTSIHHRGKGLGKLLCRAAISYAANFDKDKRARVRLFLSPYNTGIMRFYADLGFCDGGRCTWEEAMISNGNEAQLPPPSDRDPEKYQTRIGIAMILVT